MADSDSASDDRQPARPLIQASRGRQRKRPTRTPAPAHWTLRDVVPQQPRNVGIMFAQHSERQRQRRLNTDFNNGCPVCYYQRSCRPTHQIQNFVIQNQPASTNWQQDFLLDPNVTYDRNSPYRKLLLSAIKSNLDMHDDFVCPEITPTSNGETVPQNYRVTARLI